MEERQKLEKSVKLVANILNKCVDTNKNKLPAGVGFKHIYQVKSNSYVNTIRDIMSLNLYFKGHKAISNQAYYTVDNLSEDKFIQCRNAIYDVVEAMNDVFSDYDIDLSFTTTSDDKPKYTARQMKQLKELE